MPLPNDPAAAWAKGWAVSRGTSAPVEIPEGFRIDVGRPEHRVRYVIPRYDESVLRTLVDRLERLDEPGTWLKVCAEPAVVSGVLGDRWQVRPPEYLMTMELSPQVGAAPASYRVEVVGGDEVIDTSVSTADGRRAARGRAALTGAAVVIDQVETEPEHRRRGLGRLVMRSLTDAAVQRGAATGVLVATEDGRALYSSLGWSLQSTVTAAALT